MEQLEILLKKLNIQDVEDMDHLKKVNDDLLTKINEKRLKNKESIIKYRQNPEKKEILKNISKKCYDKLKDNEEKYQQMLQKKKIYYQQNKEKLLLKNKERYILIKEMMKTQKDQEEQQYNKITYVV